VTKLTPVGAPARETAVPAPRSRRSIYVAAGALVAPALVMAVLRVGEQAGRLSDWQALVLGTTQGLTELLPISSSGHLILVPWLFDWHYLESHESFNKTFDVALHLGTLVAVVAYFWNDVVRYTLAWLRSVRRRRVQATDERLAWYIAAATVPAALAGRALPGTPLWPLRQAGQQVRLGLTADPVQRAHLRLNTAAMLLDAARGSGGYRRAGLAACQEQIQAAMAQLGGHAGPEAAAERARAEDLLAGLDSLVRSAGGGERSGPGPGRGDDRSGVGEGGSSGSGGSGDQGGSRGAGGPEGPGDD